MAFDEQLAERVRQGFSAAKVPYQEKRMMGGLCFMVRDKMCVGVEKDRMMARIGPEREADALARPGCTPMDFTGRPLRGFVFVARDVLTRDVDLRFWLRLALDFNPQAKSSRKQPQKRAPQNAPGKQSQTPRKERKADQGRKSRVARSG